jgi:hypothetical protein
MKNLNKIAFVLVLLTAFGAAQSLTPNTTLCAAITATQTNICLTATSGSSPNWSIVNQTGIYVDGEFMVVGLSNSQVISGTSQQVPVSRNNRYAGSGPTAHANGAIAWIATKGSGSAIPGVNGFTVGTTISEIGPCTRAAIVYLPHIYPARNMKRDCAQAGTATLAGMWVDYAPKSGTDYESPTPPQLVAANSALSVSSGNYILITKAGVIALTLAAPTAGVQDGMVITITADNGAFADTLTATALLQTGGAGSPYTTATFGVTSAFNGASLTLKSYGGFWFVVASVNVAFT